MSSDTDNFTYWNPRILATECVFQIVIMISCLSISVIEISFSDKIAAYYTILIAVDTFCDIVSDLYIEDDTNKQYFHSFQCFFPFVDYLESINSY